MEKKIVNIEQQETLQSDINKIRDSYVSTFKEEDQKKFEAVSQACKILTNANVTFYMFPMLMHPQSNVEEAVQYNNLLESNKDQSGIFSQQEKERVVFTNQSVIFCFVNLLIGFLKGSGLEFSWPNLFYLIGNECNQYSEKVRNMLPK